MNNNTNNNSDFTIQPQGPWLRGANGPIAGVCDGLGRKLEIEPYILRILWIIAVCFFGSGILFYLLLTVSLPREDDPSQGLTPKFFGVCYRLARKHNSDVGLIRFFALTLTFFSAGITLIFYFLGHFILPDLPNPSERQVN